MKFMQTIIAFFTIYLFIGIIAVALVLAAWFSTFIPNAPRQQMAQISVGLRGNFGGEFSYKTTNSQNALSTMITRNTPQNKEIKTSEVLSARSEVLFATFTDVTLSDALVPLGFSHMYRLEKVVDASGNIVYQRKETWVDAIAWGLLGKNLSRGKEETMFIASDKDQTYTVNASINGLEVVQQ